MGYRVFLFMQRKCTAQVLQLVYAAVQLDMPKLLACCENYIAAESGSRFNLLQLGPHLPVTSALRISKGLIAAYFKSKILRGSESCRCPCCDKHKVSMAALGPAQSCSCISPPAIMRPTTSHLRRDVPTANEFARWAASDVR